jgi:hypothetical protein
MKVIRWVATSSNQCFLRHYTMQLRFGNAMLFDNRLIAARGIGGAWSVGEADSQNERLWNGRLWPRKADVGMRKSFSSPNEKPSVKLRRPDGPCDKPKRWHQAVFQDSNRTARIRSCRSAGVVPSIQYGCRPRRICRIDDWIRPCQTILRGWQMFLAAFCTGTICNLERLMIRHRAQRTANLWRRLS